LRDYRGATSTHDSATMATTHTITHSEILQMAEAVSQEKGLDKAVIFSAIEAALATATRRRHEEDIDARVSIDQDSGEYDSFRVWHVIADDEEVEFPDHQIPLTEAQKKHPDIEVGATIEAPLANVEFGRIAAQAAKQVILQKVREAVREQTAERYKDKRGVLLSGTVKRLDRGNAVIDLGDSEALLPRGRHDSAARACAPATASARCCWTSTPRRAARN